MRPRSRRLRGAFFRPRKCSNDPAVKLADTLNPNRGDDGDAFSAAERRHATSCVSWRNCEPTRRRMLLSRRGRRKRRRRRADAVPLVSHATLICPTGRAWTCVEGKRELVKAQVAVVVVIIITITTTRIFLLC